MASKSGIDSGFMGSEPYAICKIWWNLFKNKIHKVLNTKLRPTFFLIEKKSQPIYFLRQLINTPNLVNK